jgi:HAD superfamily hydrolase (TIGR01484 family)
MKKLIVFDLDGTLAPSKFRIDDEMAALIGELLKVIKVAVISGGGFPQFQTQLVAYLPKDAALSNLSLLPTNGTRFYQYKAGDWQLLYAEDFTPAEKATIVAALQRAVAESGFGAAHTWGEAIEDRGSQITYSALGQQAPLEEKEKWDPDFSKRKAIKTIVDKLLPNFSVNLGGTTSIDVTKPGIDKAYGIHKLRDTLGIGIDEMIYIGDAIFPGGNDYPAKQAGVTSIAVKGPEETKRVIETIVAMLSD